MSRYSQSRQGAGSRSGEPRRTSATSTAVGFPTMPTADPGWLLVETGFNLAREHEIESLFTVGNGYVGTRGSLAEGSSLSRPATFAAGVFEAEAADAAVPELTVLPDWTRLTLVVGGRPLSLEHGELLEQSRVLDLRQGIFWRDWRHQDPDGRITRLRLLRLASLADRHLLFQAALITPENYAGVVELDGSVEWPAASREVAVETGPALAPGQSVPAVLVRTTGRGVTVALAIASELRIDRGVRVEPVRAAGPSGLVERWAWDAGIGETALLCRLVAVHTSRDPRGDPGPPASAAIRHLQRAQREGPDRIVPSHTEAWAVRWAAADVQVAGDEAAQRALRFAAYHLISAGNPEDERVSIGARGLTGDAYKGHVLWDTEIYLLPFYLFTDPPTARALLMYRYHTLPAARAKAKGLGYRGALYAWESADSGEETTPASAPGPDGEVVRIRTGELEHHISADVAYAVWQYWRATGDEAFLLDAGAEILIETARFWASRGRIEADGRYHIRGVIGPDEYHEGVDDNAYTNVMARWNLARGVEAVRLLADRWPARWRQLADRLRLEPGEPETWQRLAEAMATGFDPRTGLFEQFRGYFGLEEFDLAAHAPCAAPIDVCLGRERIQRSKVIKQADVVALSALLWDEFPREVHEANFRYYEPRTAHGSSLSPPFHALVAARLGDVRLAERYFRQTAEIDLANTMGNAAGGVHIGALGGLWQAVVLGFAGLRLREDGLAFDPHLPPGWRRLSFHAQWRGRRVVVSVCGDPRGLHVVLDGEAPMTLTLIDGPVVTARPGRGYLAVWDSSGWEGWREVGP